MNMLTSPFKKPAREPLASTCNAQPSAVEPSNPHKMSTAELKAMLPQQQHVMAAMQVRLEAPLVAENTTVPDRAVAALDEIMTQDPVVSRMRQTADALTGYIQGGGKPVERPSEALGTTANCSRGDALPPPPPPRLDSFAGLAFCLHRPVPVRR